MTSTILPFSLDKSNEKLTDRGTIALVDGFAKAIGLPEEVENKFPAPGSNRGIDPSVYVRTLIYHPDRISGSISEIRRRLAVGEAGSRSAVVELFFLEADGEQHVSGFGVVRGEKQLLSDRDEPVSHGLPVRL